jgi:hypothetical protein
MRWNSAREHRRAFSAADTALAAEHIGGIQKRGQYSKNAYVTEQIRRAISKYLTEELA